MIYMTDDEIKQANQSLGFSVQVSGTGRIKPEHCKQKDAW